MRAMTISISIHGDRSATVTLRPHWLATLLLGRTEQTRNAFRYRGVGGTRWAYTDDNHDVPVQVAEALERAAAIVAVGRRLTQTLRR